jgi:hypothetical protein
MPSLRRVRTVVVIVVIAVVVALVALLVGGEAYARHRVKSCLSNQLSGPFGTKVTVGLGAKPVLLDMLDHRISSVTIDTPGDQFGPAVGMKVHVAVNDVRMENSSKGAGTIGSSSADVTWSSDGIAQTLKKSLDGLVQQVQADPADDVLEIDGILGTKITVRPQITNGVVEVTTQTAQVLGIGLPADLVDSVLQSMTTSLQQPYPLGMRTQSVRVTDSGVAVNLRGGRYDLPPVPPGTDVCAPPSNPTTNNGPGPS